MVSFIPTHTKGPYYMYGTEQYYITIATTIMLGMGCAKSGKLGNYAFKSPETPTDIG